jgi:hypothetical protein
MVRAEEPVTEAVRPIRYAKAGGVDIAYRVVGEGPLDLVWVPGLFSNIEIEWENPGLWTRPQPSGIRVSDAVAWAREILERYGDMGTGTPPTVLP